VSKNLGALLAPILCGIVGEKYGYNYGYILTAIGMFSGVIVFILGRKHLVIPETHRLQSKRSGLYKSLIYTSIIPAFLFLQYVLARHLDSYLLLLMGIVVAFFLMLMAKRRSKVERKHLLAIVILLVFVVVFSAFLAQGGAMFNLFIERIVNRRFLGVIVPTSVFFALDPIFMLLLGPILASLSFVLVRRNRNPSAPIKFAGGLFLLALGFGIFMLAAHRAELFGKISALYIIFAYFALPLGELLIMPIAMSTIARLTPKGFDAIMMGVFFFSTSFSGYLTGLISKLGEVNFKIITFADIQHAAKIYQHAFGDSVLIIMGVVLLLLVLAPFLRGLMLEKVKTVK